MRPGLTTEVRNPIDAVQPSEKAQKILAAARDVFLTHGFSASTDTIQQAAGVSKATIYAHFDSKEALFVAVVEKQCNGLMELLRNAGSLAGQLREALTAIGRIYLTHALSPTGLALVRIVASEAPRFPQLARTFYVSGPEVFCSIIGEHLKRGVENGEVELSAIGLDSATQQFCSLVRGQAQLELLMHPHSRASENQIEHWVDIAVITFLRAYGPR